VSYSDVLVWDAPFAGIPFKAIVLITRYSPPRSNSGSHCSRKQQVPSGNRMMSRGSSVFVKSVITAIKKVWMLSLHLCRLLDFTRQ
jgi:hypothetical protein